MVKGQKTRRTIEREARAEVMKEAVAEIVAKHGEIIPPGSVSAEEVAQAAKTVIMKRRFVAVDGLEELAGMLKSVVLHYQTQAMGLGPNGELVIHNEKGMAVLKSWGEFFRDTMLGIAQYQSPRLKATASLIVPTGEDFDSAGRRDADEAKIARMGDPIAASRAYQQLILAPRQMRLPPPSKKAEPEPEKKPASKKRAAG